mgnify:CR=1 FL=1
MIRFVSLLMLSLTLAACAQAPSSAGDSPQTSPSGTSDTKSISGESPLGGYLWQLEDATDRQGHRIDVLLVRPDMPIQFDFAGDRIAGRRAAGRAGAQRQTGHHHGQPAGCGREHPKGWPAQARGTVKHPGANL